MHFASLYRWMVATQYWQLPQVFQGSVLDIGTDDGCFLERVTVDRKLGVDLRRPARVSFPFVQADATALPFPSDLFHHVFAFDIVEHVMRDDVLVSEALRVLAPSGILWLGTTAECFTVFPGGKVQERLHRSWGHVRRGYHLQSLIDMIPDNARVLDVLIWNEPWFRLAYIGVWFLARCKFPWTNSVISRLVALDALHPKGKAGHVFLKIGKVGSAGLSGTMADAR